MKIIYKQSKEDRISSSLEMSSSGIKAYEDVKNKNLTFKSFYDLHQTIQNIEWEKLDLKKDNE